MRGQSANDQQFQFNLQTQGRLVTAEQFGNIVIRANPDGSVLRVRDVARVELGAQNMDSETRLNGHPGVPIGIYLAPGSNAVDTAHAVAATLARAQAHFPPGLHAQIMYDSTTFVSDTRREVLRTLAIAFVLVVAVVFLFLGSMRATIIPTVAVPVSLVGTFAALLALGYTENTVSLLALVLAVGIVVDDAIVVVENVERVMEDHPELSPAEATRQAMLQITGPIIAITLVLLSVFVPVGFIPGLSGVMFRQFAVTISCAMLISALNALTLSPALCAVFLRHRPRRGIMGRLLDGIDRVRNGYAAVVQRLIRFSAAVGCGDRGLRCRYLRRVAQHPDGLPADRGPGRVLRCRSIAGWRVGAAHRGLSRSASRRSCKACRRSRIHWRSLGFHCWMAPRNPTPHSSWRG